ncbi:MAG: hotdog domain-containing protein, partial [Planctomycetota bacterium]
VGASEGESQASSAEEGDVRAALDLLEREHPGAELWAGGFSFGSRASGRVALEDTRIARLVLIAPPVDIYDCGFLAELRRPTLALFGERDEFGTLASLRRLHPDVPPSLDAREIADADHFFRGHTPLVEAAVLDFAQDQLSAPTMSPCDDYPTEMAPAIRRVMMPRDTNAFGTIFGGVILSEIDLAAAVEAHKHHDGPLVTIAMDKIEFHKPVYTGDLVTCFTETQRIGTTSITVRVCVWAERRFGGDDGTRTQVTEAQVTMVAVDQSGNKVPVSRRK